MVKYFSVKDNLAEAFNAPFASRTTGEATRMFLDAVADPQSPFHRHPGDYDLYEVANWNDHIGSFVPVVGGARLVLKGTDVAAGAGAPVNDPFQSDRVKPN